MRMVADSSVLRGVALEEFLQASAENCAVISEVTAFESYKGDPVVNASRNYAICARFPRQILVLRGVREIIDAERHKNLETLDYVDHEQTAGFGRYCRLLALRLASRAMDVPLTLTPAPGKCTWSSWTIEFAPAAATPASGFSLNGTRARGLRFVRLND